MLQIGIYTASYTKYTQNAVLHILLTCCGHLLPPRTFIQNLKKKTSGKVLHQWHVLFGSWSAQNN